MDKNYKKLWEIGLFDLSKRKKEQFLGILHNLKVHCFMEKNYLNELFKKQNLKQKEIAKLINSWQGNISRLIRGKHQLTIEQFHLLSKRINQNNHFDKINKIRIGNSTTLRNNNDNKKFINYLFTSKVTNF